ncbi:MAG: hypothetical protein LBN34_04745 [Clostridiales Family XIII bacterium]|jgi:uncharacterized membrane protein YkvI|nr:hypothetical protein [Clostridiales Family XIII bacterium]
METKSKINIRNLFVVAGAYTSYTIGAGFASGNEVLQFFGSWGVPGAFIAAIFGLIMNCYFCASAYKAGQGNDFAQSRDVYTYYAGKYVGWVFDIFVVIFVLGIFATMFAGAGSTINQFISLPQWVGSLGIGIISAVVVFGGLKVVEQVLGYAGIVIIIFIVIVGIITIVSPNANLDQSSEVANLVKEGAIWQANMFEIMPGGVGASLSGLNSSWLDGLCYAGVCLVVCVPFIVSLGKSTKSQSEATFAGIFSGVFFYIGAFLVIIILLSNANGLIDPATNEMFPIPTLAAVTYLLPGISWMFVIILIAGIFTTITGYLWLLTDRVFGSTPTTKSRIFTAVLMIIGVLAGSVLPFSAVVNFLWPISGFVGIILVIFMIVKDIRLATSSKSKTAA